MKVRIVGGPVEGKVEIEVDVAATFVSIMTVAEGAVGKGPLADKFVFVKAEVQDKKVKPIAQVKGSETPLSASLPSSGAILMLKAAPGGYGAAGSTPPITPPTSARGEAKATPPPTAAPSVPTLNIPAKPSYRDRMVAIYEKYEPAKVSTVDSTLEKFKGKEEAVIKKLVEKYGPEPLATEPAAPSPTSTADVQLSARSAPMNSARSTGPQVLSYRDRMIAMYEKYEPSKASTVDATLEKFKGKEEAVIKKLVEKYGPEPVPQQVAGSSAAPTPSSLSPVPTPVATPRLSYRDRLVAIYEKYEPSKVSTVDSTLEKFKGKEEAVIKKLVEKYGPEPKSNEAASPSTGSAGPHPAQAVEPIPNPVDRHEATPELTPRELAQGGTVMTPRDDPPNDSIARSIVVPNSHPPTREETPTQDGDTVSAAAAPTSAPPPVPALPLSPPVPSQPAGPTYNRKRVEKLAALALASITSVSEKSLRLTCFSQWCNFFLHRKAAALVRAGVFVQSSQSHDSFELVGSKPLLVVGSLTDFIRPGGVHQLLSEQLDVSLSHCQNGMQNFALAQAGVLDKDQMVQQALQPRAFRRDDKNTSDLLNNIAANFPIAIAVTAERDELQRQLNDTRSKLMVLQGEHARLQQAFEKADPLAQRCISAEEFVQELQTHCGIIEDKLKASTGEITDLKRDHARVSRELSQERKGIPTDLEKTVMLKDEAIAQLQQQLAKTRTRLRVLEAERKEWQAQNEKEQQMKGALVARANTRRERFSTSPNRLVSRSTSQPRGLLSSPPPYAARSPNKDAEFDPLEVGAGHLVDDRQPSPDPFSADLSDIPPAPNRGVCPHCICQLTPFFSEQFGTAADFAKVAFCFSCRRSFTQKDLEQRDVLMSSGGSAKRPSRNR